MMLKGLKEWCGTDAGGVGMQQGGSGGIVTPDIVQGGRRIMC